MKYASEFKIRASKLTIVFAYKILHNITNDKEIGDAMAVCYFDNDFSVFYRCTYSFDDEKVLSVEVEYDIVEEITSNNGVRFVGSESYSNRDIIVADAENKKFYLMKNAFYIGNSNRYAVVDSKSITKFKSLIYFSYRTFDGLARLVKTPKCTAIRIYSRDFIAYMGLKSVKQNSSEDKLAIFLNKNEEPIDFDISTPKINYIKYCDRWERKLDFKHGKILIDIMPYIEIQFRRSQRYDDMHKFIFELALYLQLFAKEGFKLDEISVCINGIWYGLHCSVRNFKYSEKGRTIVDDQLPTFLKKCFLNIDYAFTTKIWLRNISYAVGDRARNIEDTFLLLYKFIECFYKAKNEKGVNNSFIFRAIKEHYLDKKYSDEELKRLSREVVCLRNHYVHSGYFIKNYCLRISKPKDDSSFAPYTAKVDSEWIYTKTDMLNKITLDIIYREILGYDHYQI